MQTNLNFSSYRGNKSPFTLGPEQRPLRIFIDREHLIDGKPTQLLDEFASHDELVGVTTHKDGQDRIVFGERSDDLLRVQVITDSGVIHTGVTFVSQWDELARQPILRDGLILPSGPWTDEVYRLRQYLLAKVAESLRADAFITDDPFLLDFRRPDFIPLNFVSSRDAVALIGSYLRNRRDFTIEMGTLKGDTPLTRKLGRGLFYWVLGRDLLPNSWRWFDAIVMSDGATGGDLTSLGQSALTRLAQALKARDHAHWQLLQPHDNETADDTLFYLDMLLLSLSAAFDVVAHVADAALGLASRPQYISWNSNSWRADLRDGHQPLDAAMAPSAPYGQIHRLLSLLRNSIHGEALKTLAQKSGWEPLENLLVLPKADRDALRYLLSQLGGLDIWGHEDIAGLFACVRPGMVIEQLAPLAAAALNELMALTPVERLPGLGQTSHIMEGPPAHGIWGEETRHRVRLLSGL
jgi:hypothetical protein